MRNLKIVLCTFLFALAASAASARPGLVASSGADCDGDGVNDISCSGSQCAAEDSRPGFPGYCECTDRNYEREDRQDCKANAQFYYASFLGLEQPWLTTPSEKEDGTEAEMDPESALPEPTKVSADAE
ncbi:MAG: hypothetical protein AAF725_18780 [Acidobacteriota bacterium]